MSKIIIGNWKMNPASLNEAVLLVSAISQAVRAQDFEKMVLLPPFIFLEEMAKNFKQINWGAQDVFWESKGAYTGEVSVEMLKNLGVSWVLVGHSERRRLFGETDEMVNQKALFASSQGFNVIVAVGELQRDEEEKYIINSLLKSINGVNFNKLYVAYEPVWAISTTPGAEPDDPERSNRILGLLKTKAREYFGDEAESIKFLYGGSVGLENAESFLKMPNVEGVLVGGASLKAKDFSGIVSLPYPSSPPT